MAKKKTYSKVECQLVKRMGDGPTGEIKYQIEVPESLIAKTLELERHKGEFFLLIGPMKEEAEIKLVQVALEQLEKKGIIGPGLTLEKKED